MQPPAARLRRLVSIVLLLGGCQEVERRRPNVLLITVDTLRADHLGCYGYPRPTSPAIDRLAREGVRVARAYAAAPITAPAHASILTGRYPLRHGVRTNGVYRLAEEELTLAEILAANGYQTAAFVGAIPLDARFGFGQGFATFDADFKSSLLRAQYLTPWYELPVGERERRADEVVGPATRWLATRAPGRPFFLWVHLFDPHHPYVPPPPFDVQFDDQPRTGGRDPVWQALLREPAPWHGWLRGLGGLEQVIARYDGEIAFADQQIGLLLETLTAAGDDAETIVALTADHGEGLGEHAEFFFHGDQVFETTVRVPLILRAPGRLVPGTVARAAARGIDLLPTLLELAEIPLPTAIDGRSLVAGLTAGEPAASDQPALIEAAYRDRSGNGRFALVDGGFKLVQTDPTADRPGAVELFDLAHDPREVRDLSQSRGTDTARMLAKIASLRETLAATAGAAPDVPADVIEALESLGYLNHGGEPTAPPDDQPEPPR